MLNRVILMGRLTKDPELKYTAAPTAVCTFTIAVKRDYVQQGGQNDTDFIIVVAWRKTAEFICKHFKKGNMIVVCGKLQTRTWDSTDGRKNYATEVVTDDVYFGEAKPIQSPTAYTCPDDDVVDTGDFVPIDNDDDLPF